MTQAGLELLMEGRPGVGKTTLALRIIRRLQGAGLDVRGFTTSEIRIGGRRVGFEVSRIGGNSEVLAHIDFSGPPRVGRYGVDLDAFERVALPALEEPGHVVVIDELGKMELASPRFVAAVDGALASDRVVLATVHVHRHPITDRYKRSPGVEVVHVTVANRDRLVDEIADRLVSQIRGRNG